MQKFTKKIPVNIFFQLSSLFEIHVFSLVCKKLMSFTISTYEVFEFIAAHFNPLHFNTFSK